MRRSAAYLGEDSAHHGEGFRASWGGGDGCSLAAGSIAGALLCENSAAYEPSLHQQFTFIAAQQLNRCLEGSSLPRLTPLQVRYIAKSDVAQAQGSWYRAPFRWGYYDRAAQEQRKLLWVVDTRLHDHFEQLEGDLSQAHEMGDQYSDLGAHRQLPAEHDVASPRGAGVLHALVAPQRV